MATAGEMNGTLLVVYSAGNQIGATTNHSLSVSQALREATTKDSSAWREVAAGLREWSMSAEGLYSIDETYGADYLYTLVSGRTEVAVKFTTEVTGDERYTGQAYISSLDITSGLEETVTWSAEFQGTSTLTKETVT